MAIVALTVLMRLSVTRRTGRDLGRNRSVPNRYSLQRRGHSWKWL